MTSSSHLFHFQNLTPQKVRPGGTRKDITAENFPALSGMSLSILDLRPKGVREPHWHPNAAELSFCLEGKALMTIFSPGAGHNTFTIEPGELVFVPKGYLHHIENISSGSTKLLICFDHERPEDLDLSSAVNSMPSYVMEASVKTSAWDHCKKAGLSVFISEQESVKNVPFIANEHKLNLEKVNPQIQTAGGTVKLSNAFMLPPLKGLACYSLHLFKAGMREPHWHPNASELNYLIRGKARITLLSPGNKIDTFDMTAGDVSFMPKSYFHYIENTGDEDAWFVVFFNNEYPSDIGITGSLGAYSNELLASIFGQPARYFQDMKKYQQDLFVVGGGG